MKKQLLKYTLAFSLVVALATTSQAQDKQKMLTKMWKMIKTEVGGSEVKPKHDHMVIQLGKKGEFVITAKLEETHKGKWKLSDDKNSIVLTDATMENTIMTLKIEKLDEGHLALSNYDGEANKTIFFIPLSRKKAIHLSHKEFLLCKEWTVDKSEKKETEGMKFVFNYNKTFVILPRDSHTPISSGKWDMSKDHKKLQMEMKEGEGQNLDLDIVTLHRHELVLENKENGFTKHFIDHRLSTPTEAPKEEK